MDAVLKSIINASPAPERPEGITDEHIVRYNTEALVRFRHMTKQNSPHIRYNEVALYIAIHESIEAKGHNWNKLDKLEKNELMDAWYEEH